MQDPIADMLTRIRNAQRSKHPEVKLPASNIKHGIARVLKEEGYINDFRIDVDNSNFKSLIISLKYFQNKPVIEHLRRISRPGLRIYKSVKELHPVSGFGIAILSTPKGIMSLSAARKANVAGELICEVA